MQRILQHPFKLVLLALTIYCYWEGGHKAALGMVIISAGLLLCRWMVWFIIRWLWSRRRPQTPRRLIARVTGLAPWGRRDKDISACFTRLDPAWQEWLATDIRKME